MNDNKMSIIKQFYNKFFTTKYDTLEDSRKRYLRTWIFTILSLIPHFCFLMINDMEKYNAMPEVLKVLIEIGWFSELILIPFAISNIFGYLFAFYKVVTATIKYTSICSFITVPMALAAALYFGFTTPTCICIWALKRAKDDYAFMKDTARLNAEEELTSKMIV